MPESLFDRSAEYEQMLNQGIRLSGEGRGFFSAGRLRSLRAKLAPDFKPSRILDYGCGNGDTAFELARMFAPAEVVGVETSVPALQHAAEHYGSASIRFRRVEELSYEDGFDLCYVNGVFHHIEPSQRIGAIAGIYRALRPNGRLALFENNPWNIGARMVMRRIPFDRDTQPLSPREAGKLVRAGGFVRPAVMWSLFYFPRPLAFLRFTEGALSHLPLGAQYGILVTKDS
jgi:SAM-dependent methyltransferase